MEESDAEQAALPLISAEQPPLSAASASSSAAAIESDAADGVLLGSWVAPRLPGAMSDKDYMAALRDDERAAFAQFVAELQLTNPMALRLPERQLMRLLFARKLDVNRALALLENHLVWRERYGIDLLTPRHIEALLRSGMNVVALGPGARTADGAGVAYLFFRLGPKKTDKLKPSVRDMVQLNWLLGELLSLDNVDNDRHGFVVVLDFTGAALLSQYLWSKAELKEIMGCTQDCMPGRIRGVWILNMPWWIRLAMMFASAFMKKKLTEKLTTMDQATLLQRIPAGALIPELGGTGAPVGWPHIVDQLLQSSPELRTSTAAAAEEPAAT